jgi:purine nucleoside phosphorylase
VLHLGYVDGKIFWAQTHIRLGLDPKNNYKTREGPRLETAAEVDRIDNDGGHYVGMTLMPEACLARELHLKYAAICQIVNTAAGRGSSEKGIVLADTKEALTKATKESVDLALTTFRSLAD